MSSTDERDERARRFFSEHIVPAAEQLRARGIRFFPPGPEPERATWFEPCDPQAGLQELDPSRHAERLAASWIEQGLPELAELAGPLMELAESMRDQDRATGDVSPFIYVMF